MNGSLIQYSHDENDTRKMTPQNRQKLLIRGSSRFWAEYGSRAEERVEGYEETRRRSEDESGGEKRENERQDPG